ncbi:MAG: ABC-2 transporter permease [Oscillibacter sp.]|nr:ABC-2 transporter permease [Oscillibacter sp.]
MKGLLLKDWYLLRKAVVTYVVITLAFQAMPASGGILTVLYAATLPASAFAYDDRSRWGDLAAMLPCSVRDIVLSRYLLGWGGCLFFNLTALAGQALFAALLPNYLESRLFTGFPGFITTLSVSLLFLAMTLPLNFRFDTEKSRIIRYVLLCLIAGASGSILVIGGIEQRYAGGSVDAIFLWPVLLAVSVILSAASVPLSMWAYRARRK